MMWNELQNVSPWWWLLAGILGTLVLVGALRWWQHMSMLEARVPRRPAATTAASSAASAQPLARADAALQPVAEAAQRARLTDPLTGLCTRLMLEDQLASAVLRAEARRRRVALLYIVGGF